MSHQYNILSKFKKKGIPSVLHPWISSTKKNKKVKLEQSLLSQIVAYASQVYLFTQMHRW